jgi:hypothetical protein
MTRSACRICGEDDDEQLGTHRVVPARYGGSDAEENCVTLCARCREAVESIYDEGFYERLGVAADTAGGPEAAADDGTGPEPETGSAAGDAGESGATEPTIELRELETVYDAADGDLLYAAVYDHFFAVTVVDSGWRGRRLELTPVPGEPEGADAPDPVTLYEREDRPREIEQGAIHAVERVDGDLMTALERYVRRQ